MRMLGERTLVETDMVFCEGGCFQAVAMAVPRSDSGGLGSANQPDHGVFVWGKRRDWVASLIRQGTSKSLALDARNDVVGVDKFGNSCWSSSQSRSQPSSLRRKEPAPYL